MSHWLIELFIMIEKEQNHLSTKMLLRFLLLVLSVNSCNSTLFHIEILFLEYFATGLSFYTTDKGLSEAFSQYGQVVEGDFHSDTLAFMSNSNHENLVSWSITQFSQLQLKSWRTESLISQRDLDSSPLHPKTKLIQHWPRWMERSALPSIITFTS